MGQGTLPPHQVGKPPQEGHLVGGIREGHLPHLGEDRPLASQGLGPVDGEGLSQEEDLSFRGPKLPGEEP